MGSQDQWTSYKSPSGRTRGAEQPLLQASEPAPASGALTRSSRACTHRSPLPWLYTPVRTSDLGVAPVPGLWAPLSVATPLRVRAGLADRPHPAPPRAAPTPGAFLRGSGNSRVKTTRTSSSPVVATPVGDFRDPSVRDFLGQLVCVAFPESF